MEQICLDVLSQKCLGGAGLHSSKEPLVKDIRVQEQEISAPSLGSEQSQRHALPSRVPCEMRLKLPAMELCLNHTCLAFILPTHPHPGLSCKSFFNKLITPESSSSGSAEELSQMIFSASWNSKPETESTNIISPRWASEKSRVEQHNSDYGWCNDSLSKLQL